MALLVSLLKTFLASVALKLFEYLLKLSASHPGTPDDTDYPVQGLLASEKGHQAVSGGVF